MFKNLLVLSSLTILSACYVNPYNLLQEHDAKSTKTLLQKYDAESNANANSDFGVLNRKIEFEFEILEIDTILNLIIRLTSGYNEGELLPNFEIMTQDNDVILLTAHEVSYREYVEEYNYTTSTPFTSQQIVNDPGGVDVVVQADGTHKHVHRPPSSKTVNVTENQVRNHSKSKSQIYNELKVVLGSESIEAIRSISNFKVFFSSSDLLISPTRNQKYELANYLNSRN